MDMVIWRVIEAADAPSARGGWVSRVLSVQLATLVTAAGNK